MLRSCLIGFLLAFGLAVGGRAWAQMVYFNTSSASQPLNTLDSVGANGASAASLFTASGSVLGCTAMAVDLLNGKLFFVDAGTDSLWSVNLNGSDLTPVKSGLTGYPTDLALDALNQRIYLATSSTIQNSNTVQAMDYTGSGDVTVFTATGPGGNGVSRCTAISVDLSNSKIFIADAGAQKIWSMDFSGGGLSEVAATPNAFPTDVALDPSHRQVYFTASSTVQASNLVQRVNYDGSGLTTLLIASGSVERCTALDLDLKDSLIYMADAGANTLWRIPLAGGSASVVLSGLPATAKRVRWYSGPSSRPPAGLTGIQISGSNAILSATNGFIGGTYYILTSTNVFTPLSQWLPISTNILAASGSFTLSATNTVGNGGRQRFFLIKVQ